MKSINKILSVVMSMILMIVSPINVSAKAEEESVQVNFEDFYFETSDYSMDEVYIEKEIKNGVEYAFIKEKDTHNILETLSVEKVQTYSNDDVIAYTFKRYNDFGKTRLVLQVQVELYYSGSFRAINRYLGSLLVIDSRVTETYIEDKLVNVWSIDDIYPTAELLYAYSGVLVAEVDRSTSAEIKGEITSDLFGGGFAFTESNGSTEYYRRTFDYSGEINLYE